MNKIIGLVINTKKNIKKSQCLSCIILVTKKNIINITHIYTQFILVIEIELKNFVTQ